MEAPVIEAARMRKLTLAPIPLFRDHALLLCQTATPIQYSTSIGMVQKCKCSERSGVHTSQHHTQQEGSTCCWPGSASEREVNVARVAVAQRTLRFSAQFFNFKSLHLLEKKQAAGSGRPTQKLPPPTRKLRAVTRKVAGDVAVLGREKFG